MGERILRIVPGWLVFVLALGCASPSAERGEPSPSGEADGPLAGAETLPPELREEIEQADAEQEASGAFAEAERGAGADDAHGDAGLGALFYFYVALGAALFLYLVWLLRARHQERQPDWRLK